MSNSLVLADALREYRFYNCLTQSELAEILDVSLRTVQNWENCKSFPSAKNFRKIIDNLR